MNSEPKNNELIKTRIKATGKIENRKKYWKEKQPTDPLQIEGNCTEMKKPIRFPQHNLFKPLNELQHVEIINREAIDSWFLKKDGRKEIENGRILALKLFVKYIRIHADQNLFFIKAKCFADQQQTVQYAVLMVILKKPKNCSEILQAACSCPVGTCFTAACKHVGAVSFSLEHFSLTGRMQDYEACKHESAESWITKSKGNEFMSIFHIIKVPKTNIRVCDSFTERTINKLISSGIVCPITQSKKINVDAYENDHTYVSDVKNEKS